MRRRRCAGCIITIDTEDEGRLSLQNICNTALFHTLSTHTKIRLTLTKYTCETLKYGCEYYDIILLS
jgi:hypothetical protein